MLTVNKFDRYDLVNTPGESKASFTIWFSGCSLQCEGCYNPMLFDKSNGSEHDSNTLLFVVCNECKKLELDTVVLLGGEPLEQDRNDLILFLRKLSYYGYKIWLYTGWEFEQIPNEIKNFLYTIKCGRYDESLKCEGFPASTNQKIYRKISDEWQQITL